MPDLHNHVHQIAPHLDHIQRAIEQRDLLRSCDIGQDQHQPGVQFQITVERNEIARIVRDKRQIAPEQDIHQRAVASARAPDPRDVVRFVPPLARFLGERGREALIDQEAQTGKPRALAQRITASMPSTGSVG